MFAEGEAPGTEAQLQISVSYFWPSEIEHEGSCVNLSVKQYSGKRKFQKKSTEGQSWDLKRNFCHMVFPCCGFSLPDSEVPCLCSPSFLLPALALVESVPVSEAGLRTCCSVCPSASLASTLLLGLLLTSSREMEVTVWTFVCPRDFRTLF